jgi:very-short-patch-repair endonuclease
MEAYVEKFPLRSTGSEDLDALHRTALRAAVLRQVIYISHDLEQAVELCESPPERAMLYALAISAWDYADGVLLRFGGGAQGLVTTHSTWIEIEPQSQQGDFRIDFVISQRRRQGDGSTVEARLAIECDGYEFHERTAEQARRDRRRDRELQSRDIAVFRYLGSDVWRDVFQAANEAVAELGRRFASRLPA